MTVPRDALLRLLSVEADIVGGMCCTRDPRGGITAALIVERGASADPLRPTDDPGFGCRRLDPQMENHGVIEVDICGTGVMLIRRTVFETMEPPWFVANERTNPGQNSDFNFCMRAKGCGFTILCDTSVPCGHMTAMSVTPAVAVRLNSPDSQLVAAGAP